MLFIMVMIDGAEFTELVSSLVYVMSRLEEMQMKMVNDMNLDEEAVERIFNWFYRFWFCRWTDWTTRSFDSDIALN